MRISRKHFGGSYPALQNGLYNVPHLSCACIVLTTACFTAGHPLDYCVELVIKDKYRLSHFTRGVVLSLKHKRSVI